MFDIYNKDTLRSTVEKVSGGVNTIIYDQFGTPNLMMVFSKFKVEDYTNATIWYNENTEEWEDDSANFMTGTHPAFIVDGNEVDYIFMSPYSSVAIESVTGVKIMHPQKNVGLLTDLSIPQAREYASNKGDGWHLTNVWENSLLLFSHIKKMLITSVLESGNILPDELNNQSLFFNSKSYSNRQYAMILSYFEGIDPYQLINRILVGQTTGNKYRVRSFFGYNTTQDYDEEITFNLNIPFSYLHIFVEVIPESFDYDTFNNEVDFYEDVNVEGTNIKAGTLYGIAHQVLGGAIVPNIDIDLKVNLFNELSGLYLQQRFVDGCFAESNHRIRMMNTNDFQLSEGDWALQDAYIVKDGNLSVNGVSQYPQLGVAFDNNSYAWNEGTNNDGNSGLVSIPINWYKFIGTSQFRSNANLLRKFKTSCIIPTIFGGRQIPNYLLNNNYKDDFRTMVTNNNSLSVTYGNNHSQLPTETYINKAYMYTNHLYNNNSPSFLSGAHSANGTILMSTRSFNLSYVPI